MSDSALQPVAKEILMASGVPCELPVAPRGKNSTTHLLKRLAVAIARELGLPHEDTRRQAGHAHDTTEDFYADTTDDSTMFRRAGYGPQWQTNHHLGRAAVEPPASLLELVLPGHDALLASSSFANADALRWLLVVWLQDAPLKAEAEREAWTQHFPQMLVIAAHPDWPRFREAVLQRHAESLVASRAPARCVHLPLRTVRPCRKW